MSNGKWLVIALWVFCPIAMLFALWVQRDNELYPATPKGWYDI
jgi:hypothetical protein